MAAEAQLGSAALSAKDYTAAITHLSNALSTSPTSPDYLISRSTAYQRAGQSERALKDAEAAVHYAHRRGKREAIGSAQMRRAIALYGLKRFSDAKKCFDWAKDKNEKEPGLPSWTVKVEREIAKLDEERRSEVTVVEIPEEPKEEEEAQELVGRDAETKEEEEKTDQAKTADGGAGDHTKKQPEGVQTPANKIRHEWYQTTDTVVITLLAKGVPKDKATIDIQERSVSISFPLPGSATYDFSLEPLFAAIDTTESKTSIMSTKIELVLKKAVPGQKWPSLEGSHENPSPSSSTSAPSTTAPIPTSSETKAPAYPTSSRTGPKNWDKLASDLTKKKRPTTKSSTTTTTTTTDKPASAETADTNNDDYDDDDDDLGGDAVDGFFKKIFKNADPDTRRAMMKSYQESNGTALSTNWAEVGKAKVEVQPPEGMEAKKWGE